MHIQKTQKLFTKNPFIIGALHFPPLLGHYGHPGLDVCARLALRDLRALEQGGVDAVIIENNYDLPHQIQIAPEAVATMTYLGLLLKEETSLPLGVSVLWNDYRAAFAIAKIIGAEFTRVPVFVDHVKTAYGEVRGNPKDVLSYRKRLTANQIAILADIHVKHAKILSKHSLETSARLAKKFGADGVIITGKWTGDPPPLDDLCRVRKAVGKFPVLAGSGVNAANIKDVLKYASGAIVSTSLKEGGSKKGEVNVKGWKQRISERKVRQLASLVSS